MFIHKKIGVFFGPKKVFENIYYVSCLYYIISLRILCGFCQKIKLRLKKCVSNLQSCVPLHAYFLTKPLKFKKEPWLDLLDRVQDMHVAYKKRSSINIFYTKILTKKSWFAFLFFQILWKSRCNILVSFPSHLKKLRSILRFWLEKLNCGFFHSLHSRKNTTKQLFQS